MYSLAVGKYLVVNHFNVIIIKNIFHALYKVIFSLNCLLRKVDENSSKESSIKFLNLTLHTLANMQFPI